MRISPNISSLEEVTTYILSIEADDVAKRSTQSQASNRVNNVSEIEDKEPVKKKIKYKCNLCLKVHERYGCTYSCDHCGRRGHRSEGCWIQFPHLNPHAPQPPGQPPRNRREQTPAQGPKRRGRSRRRSSDRKSDRGSSFERSASEPESPAGKAGKKKRHRSNRVKVLIPPGDSQENSSTGLAGSGLFGSSGRSNFPRNQLFPEDQPAITRKVNRITRLFSEDEDDDHPALPTRVNRIKKVNLTNPETLEINTFCGLSELFEEERDGDHLHPPGLEHYSLTHLFSGEIEDKEPGTPNKSPVAPYGNGDIIDDCLSLNHLIDTEIEDRVVEAHHGEGIIAHSQHPEIDDIDRSPPEEADRAPTDDKASGTRHTQNGDRSPGPDIVPSSMPDLVEAAPHHVANEAASMAQNLPERPNNDHGGD